MNRRKWCQLPPLLSAVISQGDKHTTQRPQISTTYFPALKNLGHLSNVQLAVLAIFIVYLENHRIVNTPLISESFLYDQVQPFNITADEAIASVCKLKEIFDMYVNETNGDVLFLMDKAHLIKRGLYHPVSDYTHLRFRCCNWN